VREDLEGRRSIQLSYGRILGYSSDSTALATLIRVRLHRREDLERALRGRGIDSANFESHLRIFDLGNAALRRFAIGLERLTAQFLNLSNVRQATLYLHDRTKLTP
jgi:hypothetical protein